MCGALASRAMIRPIRPNSPASETEMTDPPSGRIRFVLQRRHDESGAPMTVQAYILIQTEVGKAATVAAEIATLKGVTMAEDVTGPYDVIVRSEARSVDELGKPVALFLPSVC
jgi:hypothetical protein